MEYRVILTIGGIESPSSCIYSGPLANCNACADRLNRRPGIHRSHRWTVLPCVPCSLECCD